MTNKVKVVICGKDFMLQTAESANYVIGLARTLENRISEVSGSNSSTSPFAAAIMVALSTLDDLNKATQRLDALREQAKEYVDEAEKIDSPMTTPSQKISNYWQESKPLKRNCKIIGRRRTHEAIP